MQHFMIPLLLPDGSKTDGFPIYIGEAIEGVHPLEQQAAWVRRERGLTIPAEVMESFLKLRDIAFENDADFEELCVYAMSEAANDVAEGEGEEEPAAEPADD